jgi:1-phosphofructokinase family hexose kinase
LVTTLTLNAAVDRTYLVPHFSIGAFHRPEKTRAVPGGKGINVARIVRAMGHEVIASGFAGGMAAAFIKRELERAGILADFARIGEESRFCISVIDPTNSSSTQVDEAGPIVTPSEVRALKAKLPELMARSRLLVISGSLPRGVPYTVYADLIEIAREHGAHTILDTHDEPLAAAIKARPMMIKPNLAELQTLVGDELSVPDGVYGAARDFVSEGIDIVFVSLGARGAVVATRRQGNWIAKPPKVNLVSAVGSGDALVGGFATALLDNLDPPRAVARAVGAGAANAATFGACACSREEILRYSAAVNVEALS